MGPVEVAWPGVFSEWVTFADLFTAVTFLSTLHLAAPPPTHTLCDVAFKDFQQNRLMVEVVRPDNIESQSYRQFADNAIRTVEKEKRHLRQSQASVALVLWTGHIWAPTCSTVCCLK